MRRRNFAQAELKPIYVRPQLDRVQRAAAKAWCSSAYGGDRYRPKPGEFDPLWLRMGMRVKLIEDRAGWVVSNPLYDQALRRNPKYDPSLPGAGWLHEVYRRSGHRDLVTLPGVREVIESRLLMEHPRAAEPAEVFQIAPEPGVCATAGEQAELF